MNILIKLMSIVSLVIAPTLASMNGRTEAKNTIQEVKKEITFINNDNSNAIARLEPSVLKEVSEKLVDALAADKLIEKENYTVAVKKGELSIGGVKQDEEIIAKYSPLLSALGETDLELKNSNSKK